MLLFDLIAIFNYFSMPISRPQLSPPSRRRCVRKYHLRNEIFYQNSQRSLVAKQYSIWARNHNFHNNFFNLCRNFFHSLFSSLPPLYEGVSFPRKLLLHFFCVFHVMCVYDRMEVKGNFKHKHLHEKYTLRVWIDVTIRGCFIHQRKQLCSSLLIFYRWCPRCEGKVTQ